MQESVDSLIASTEAEEAAAADTAPESSEAPAPAAETIEAPTAPEQTVEKHTASLAKETAKSEDNDAVTIAHKKVLQPLNDVASKPDLDQLLAKEEARSIAEGTAGLATSAPVTSDSPIPAEAPAQPASDEPDAPTVQPGNTITPASTENSIPPTKKDDFDPNSISL
jgi:hypothetical protein